MFSVMQIYLVRREAKGFAVWILAVTILLVATLDFWMPIVTHNVNSLLTLNNNINDGQHIHLVKAPPQQIFHYNISSNDQHCLIHVHGLYRSGANVLRDVVYTSLGEDRWCSKHSHTIVPNDEGELLQNVYPPYHKRRDICTMTTTTTTTPSTRRRLVQRRQLGKRNQQRKLNMRMNMNMNMNMMNMNKKNQKAQDSTVDQPTTTTAIPNTFYSCPKLLDIAQRNNGTTKAAAALYEQWSRYWDMEKHFLIQKTQTLDLLLLERFKLDPTIHVAVLGHPLLGHALPLSTGSDSSNNNNNNYNRALKKRIKDPQHDPMVLMKTWLYAWTEVLGDLVDGKIESYAIVNTEIIFNVDYEKQLAKELSSLIRHECNLKSTTSGTVATAGGGVPGFPRTRRGGGDDENVKRNYQQPHDQKDALKLRNSCEKDLPCVEMMKDLKDVMRQLGYTWDRQGTFQRGNINNKDSSFSSSSNLLLFSSKNPPPKTLVNQMKALVAKYN